VLPAEEEQGDVYKHEEAVFSDRKFGDRRWRSSRSRKATRCG